MLYTVRKTVKESYKTALAFTVIALIVLAYFLIPKNNVPWSETMIDTSTIPPLTPEIEKQLKESRGFEFLVSYTERGFEPTEATIREGESVRFTNNSSDDLLWVAAVGTLDAPLYPGMSDCGGSLLDTCKELKPGEFWEFTFRERGDWSFRNNLKAADTGVIHVR